MDLSLPSASPIARRGLQVSQTQGVDGVHAVRRVAEPVRREDAGLAEEPERSDQPMSSSGTAVPIALAHEFTFQRGSTVSRTTGVEDNPARDRVDRDRLPREYHIL